MSEIERFNELSKMPFRAQMIWIMNGFYAKTKATQKDFMERAWLAKEKMIALDKLSDKKNGHELDVFWSAKFLEDFETAITAIQRKQALKEIDQNSSGGLSLIEYLTWKQKLSIKDVVSAPQGTSPELEEAQAKLNQVLDALEKVRQALAELAKLEAELKAAVAALEAEQKLYDDKCKALEVKIAASDTSAMQKSKAQNELAQLKAEDPLPLRRAKITQEAAVRKVEKQTKQVKVEEDQLIARVAEAQKAVDQAAAAGGGNAPGLLWTLKRELYEAENSLPKAKQTIDHSKPFSFAP
jgi:chromosome segregation ATPase